MLRSSRSIPSLDYPSIAIALNLWIAAMISPLVGEDPPSNRPLFEAQIQPLLQKHCAHCHSAENQESGIRVDNITAEPSDTQLFHLKDLRRVIESGEMPPEGETPLQADDSKRLLQWIDATFHESLMRQTQRHGSVRRLTVAQYRNTLRDLLGIQENLTDVLPPEGISKDGFTNNATAMILSPLQIESYLEIASQALDQSIVDIQQPPTIETFRMEIGKGINPNPCPDQLVLGANSLLLANSDFLVSEPRPEKPFAYQPFSMQKSFDFIEGYVGNDTIRAWKKFDSIYHAVFACMRGTPGYPKGEAYEVIDEGLLLRPAIPSAEIFGQENTYGPKANFKISLRELPEQGNFRVRVKAARYPDGLLLDADTPAIPTETNQPSFVATSMDFQVPKEGIYRIDVCTLGDQSKGLVQLRLGSRSFSGNLLKIHELSPEFRAAHSTDDARDFPTHSSPFLLVRLPAGSLPVAATQGEPSKLAGLLFSLISPESELGRRFEAFEQRKPTLGVHLGLRRDCGSTMSQVGNYQRLQSDEFREYVFEGAINDFPNPVVEKGNVNYLAGIREIGIRSEYTDGRDMPRMLIQSIEFEGPFYQEWPPATHRNLFPDSSHQTDPPKYAREILESFASKAFRRPVSPSELESLIEVWHKSFEESSDFVRSVKDAMIVVLTSPQFLFLIENSKGPEAEDIDDYELASKLSYFLWNTAPDQRLLELARQGVLRNSLSQEVDRMIADSRFQNFLEVFGGEWLSLDKFKVVSIDANRFPNLTRDVKTQLAQEPIQFLNFLFRDNLPAKNLIASDQVYVNEIVAHYYGLGSQVNCGFEFVPVIHQRPDLGGLLSQPAILSGLSNGRESNPVKRGAWLARKIIAEPPDDPPPNVPQIKENDGSPRTLREKLEEHRNQKGCIKCHMGIDPWGIPLEGIDAGGLLKKGSSTDISSKLPDGTQVNDFQEFRRYLSEERIDQVAFCFLKHLACYGNGRSLTYHELASLKKDGLKLRAEGYRARDILHFVIQSDLFLKK